MKQQSLTRRHLSALAALMLILGLAACAAPGEVGVPSTVGSEAGEKAEAADAPTSGCNWDDPRLPLTEPVLPTGQQGDLAAVVLGSWQMTHFDLGLGNGLEAWEAGTDMRYVFTSSEDLMYCVDGLGGVDRSERSESYALDNLEIVLGNGAGFTAVAWTADSLLLTNPADDSLNLFVRR